MLFTSEYSIKYGLVDTLMTAVVGMCTVVCILMTIALLIKIVSKVINGMENKGKKEDAVVVEAVTAPVAAAPVGDPLPETESQGELTLIKTDEQTAAMIMAIVSDMSGIPLNKLCFHSIKLMEDEN